MIEILTVIAPLFIIIFASALFQRYKKLGKEWSEVLNSYALQVGFPVLIFTALAKTSFSFTEEFSLIIANSLFLLFAFSFALITGKIFHLKKEMRQTLFICFAFGNIAYLGIPVLTQLSGEEILPTASIIVAIYLFWIFTLGIGYLEYSQKKQKQNILKDIGLNLLKNPLLIAVVLGLIVGGMNISLPSILMKAFEMISASVTPIVLMVIGLFIGSSKIGKWKEWISVFLFSFVILLVFPSLFHFTLNILGYSSALFSSSIIEAAMPLAITPFALAQIYPLNKIFIARAIVMSTILSIFTLPFWIWILET